MLPVSALSSAPVTDTTSVSHYDYLSCWQRWQHAPDARQNEHRRIAVERLQSCLSDSYPELNLNELNLRSLPALLPPCQALMLAYNHLEQLPMQLPATLSELDLSGNALINLSAPLPASLRELDISACALTSLPALPDGLLRLAAESNLLVSLPDTLPEGLRYLSLTGCLLNALPDSLPDSLTCLNVSLNNLQYFPSRWPAGLQKLKLTGNRLTSLPENLPDSLKKLNATDNQFSTLPARLPLSLELLDVSSCQLESLPDHLPAALTHCYLSSNQLTSLPETLPDSLQMLCLDYNRLTRLPNRLPASLINLVLMGNPLQELPATLPDSIRQLNVSNCQLTELPQRLPSRLHYLMVPRNHIMRLPETLFQLPRYCTVEIAANPLSAITRRTLAALNDDPHYQGPTVHYALPGESATHPARPLAEEVVDWYPEAQRAEVAAQWQAIDDEPGALLFSLFLQRLWETINARQDPAFRDRIVNWLSGLAASPTIRSQTFGLAQEATTHCEDRVTWYLNQMFRLEKAQQIEQGHYDQQLPELLTLARQLFRLEQLETIAQEKVASLHFVDEIEVWLAFQVQLREALQLSTVSEQMRFFGVSSVSSADLAQALKRVREQEEKHFASWLCRWDPWKKVQQRLDPLRFAAARRQHLALVAEFYPELNNAEARAALREAGAEADSEAIAAISKTIIDRRQHEIDLALTCNVLAARGLENLLVNNARGE